ncbi:MAG: GNAT family N-acetyltransferase [Clostridia bacterium]|nr:GNAT family N-acetyltransferase [Clostridia bacterium]
MKLRFEVPSKKRKQEALDYIKEFKEYNSAINGSGGLDRYIDNYEGWLEKLEQDYVRIPNEEKVPARTYFLVRNSDDRIVGMINIRLALNEKLRNYGGNIGYSIRPTERKKGYNKINLYLGLKICQEYGIKEVLMDCDKDNLGSAKTMQAFGAILTREYYCDRDNCIVQDYIIDVDKAIRDNKGKYEITNIKER